MDGNELISCFQDTLIMCENGKLKQLTEQAKESTKVYKENFKSQWSEFGYQTHLKDDDNRIAVYAGTTFATAKEYVGKGKIGVLNFANPHYPGGGVANGAMAQEECLCRSSNLYPCLLTAEAEKEYYTYNRENTDYFFSDRIIYSDNVTVFKTDDTVPTLMPENEWFNVSVITCAAPYIAQRKYTNKTALKELFKKRIKNIFEVALENNIEFLILGAFGCGAFENPPELVAKAFHEVIEENGYSCFLKNIVFAIKSTVERSNLHSCPNISAFEEEFLSFAFEANKNPKFDTLYTPKRIYSVDEKALIGDIIQLKVTNQIVRLTDKDYYTKWGIFEYAGEAINKDKEGGKKLFSHDDIAKILRKVEPVNRDKYYSLYQIKNKKGFREWKQDNGYLGKQFSILGDSISTLAGYNPSGYSVFYQGENSQKSGVSEIQHTWWGKVIDFFGGELLVNNSWSGSRVTKLPDSEKLFPSGCSDERTNGLHINNVNPDVIIVYLGTNDWAFGARRDDETRLLCYDDMEYFGDAYSEMLRKLKQNYPNAEIWCCTLNSTYMSSNSKFNFPETYNGNYIGHYNEVIRTTAKQYDCKLIDLYDYKIPYDSIDGTHPNADGMNTLATLMIRSMSDEQGKEFLNCEKNKHDYIVIDESTGNPKYICKKCGKFKHPETYNEVIDSKVKIERMKLSYGGFPIHNIEYENGKVTYYNRINGSRDGGRNYPENFFDEKTIQLNDVQVERLNMILIKVKLAEYVPDAFPKIIVPGALPHKVKYLKLSNGNEYELENTDLFAQFFDELCEFEEYPLPECENEKVLIDSEPIAGGRTEILSDLPSDNNIVTGESKRNYDTPENLIGKEIDGRYKLLKLIGRGGVSEVYIAIDMRLNKTWTVKICDKTDERFGAIGKEALLKETYLMMKLDHPAIPKIVDLIEDDKFIYIVRDYVEGQSLDRIVREYGPQPENLVVNWSKQLCDVLNYLHTLNPPHIYRDMKPANVLLTSAGKVKLIDFGIMRTYDPNKSFDEVPLGTMGYASPEGFHGQTDPRSDIYSLGVTMHELLTGVDPKQPPYEVKPICQVNPSLSKGLEYIINKCIQLNPDDRYQNCSELLQDLNQYQNLPKPKGFFKRFTRK